MRRGKLNKHFTTWARGAAALYISQHTQNSSLTFHKQKIMIYQRKKEVSVYLSLYLQPRYYVEYHSAELKSIYPQAVSRSENITHALFTFFCTHHNDEICVIDSYLYSRKKKTSNKSILRVYDYISSETGLFEMDGVAVSFSISSSSNISHCQYRTQRLNYAY